VSTDVELRLSADVDKATRDVGKFRREYVDLVREVERPLRQVNAFRSLENDLEGTQRQMRQARDRVRELGQALASAANPSRAMQAEYRDAVSELTKLERAEGALTAQLARRRNELQAAGIDTRNLANEQTRLSTALTSAVQQGNADLANANARKALGVGAIEETQRRLVELRRQYQLVSRDGSLSANQRAEAETNYRREVAQTLSQLRVMKEATRSTATTAEQAAEALVQEQRRARSAYLQTAQAAKQAAIESARGDLGVNRYRLLQSELKTTRAQYELLKKSGMLTTKELAVAQRAMTQRVRETQQALQAMNAEQNRGRGAMLVGGAIGGLGGAGAAYAAYRSIAALSRITDEYTLMAARLRLATEGQEEFNVAQQELARLADVSNSPLTSLITLYTRISRPLKEAGGSQQDILNVVEAVTLSFRVSGATAQEAENGVIQFAQALGAGALRGEEFNSVAEQAPRLMQALADSLGVPTSALRDMAKEGELTASVIVGALGGQLETLRDEFSQLPDTVGASVTDLGNKWQQAIGNADMQPLINAIDEFSETLTDPRNVQAILSIAEGMARLAGWTVSVATEFSAFAKELGYTAAAVSGYITELQQLEKTLEGVKAARFDGPFIGRPTFSFFMSDAQLDDWIAELEGKIQAVQAKISGLSADEYREQEERARQRREQQEKDEQARQEEQQKAAAAYRSYVDEIGRARDEEVEKAKASLKALVSEEKKANSELDKIRKARLEIEKSYREALDKIGGAGAEGASYGAAQQLKVDAREALQRGDFEEAQRQARAARDMLVELAEAGENTYGFEGFVKELEQIDLAANKLQENKAADELQRIQSEMEALKAKTEELKNMEVSVKLDDASLEAVRNQLAEFAKTVNGTELTIPVRTVYSDGSVDVTDIYNDFKAGNKPPGFARGGWTGPGSKYQIAGVVHADEYVQPKYRMREPGALAFMEAFRRHGMSILRNGYAEGGLVSIPRNIPFIPPMPATAGYGSLGTATLKLMLADQQYTLQGDSGTIEALLKAGKRYGLKKG